MITLVINKRQALELRQCRNGTARSVELYFDDEHHRCTRGGN
jgi:hypothetical protein